MVNHPNRGGGRESQTIDRGDVGQMPSEISNEPEAKLPALASSNALAVYDFGDEVDAIMSARREEQTIPFIRMAQGLSPELNPSKGEYTRGLVLGQIFNKATQEVYGNSVHVVVCYKEYGYGVWVPRDLGGGFRGMLPPDHPFVVGLIKRMAAKYGSSGARFRLPRYDGKTKKWSDDPPKTDDGEYVEVVETGQLYVMYGRERVTADDHEKAIVSFTRTALPSYFSYVDRHMNKKWLQSNGTKLPATLYTYHWILSTFDDSNKQGEYKNWRMDLAAPYDPPDDFPKDQRYDRYIASMIARDDPLHDAARRFFEEVRDGIVKPDYSTGGDDPATNSGTGPSINPNDVPF